MGTTTISISDEAYDFLKKIKGGRSFSEAILSLKANKDDVIEFAGALEDADLSSVREVRDESREEWGRR